MTASGSNKGNYPLSDHYNGELFFNPEGSTAKSFGQLLKWKLGSAKAEWPKWVESTHKANLPKELALGKVAITFINHATVLIQTHSYNIITDPVFSKRVSPFSWLGPARVRAPAIALAELPKIDLILVSHNHYDHMDLDSLKKIYDRDHPHIIVPLANKQTLEKAKIHESAELDWWETKTMAPNLKIHCVPAFHWSGRKLNDRSRALWSGFVVEVDNKKIYFAGDTGYSAHFKKIQAKFGFMDFSLLPIGSYEPRWFMKQNHINPEEAVIAHKELNSKKTMGIHFGTFQLTDEAIDAPVKALEEAKKKHSIPDADFTAPEFGQTFYL